MIVAASWRPMFLFCSWVTPLWQMPTPLPEYHRWPASKYMGWTA